MIYSALITAARWASAAILAWALTASAQPLTPGEYDIKAVFLFNFTHFVTWPATDGEAGSKPLIIGVLGNDPFGLRLEEAVHGEKSGNRAIVVKRFQKVEEALTCNALFIARSEASQLAEILTHLKDRPVLTVSDIPGFAEAGGIVELVTVRGKIRLHINVDEASAVQLSISAKLLRPAQIVSTRKTSRNLIHPRPNLLALERAFGGLPYLAAAETLY